MGIVERSEDRGELVKLEDGFTYYDPQAMTGCLDAWSLRVIARELDRRNAEREAIIAADPAVNGGKNA